jgi:hypothetical protein
MPKKKAYKRPRQIAVYAPDPLVDKLKVEMLKRRRKMGPCVLDILHEYFKNMNHEVPMSREG